jgi:hypothetical protein
LYPDVVSSAVATNYPFATLVVYGDIDYVLGGSSCV